MNKEYAAKRLQTRTIEILETREIAENSKKDSFQKFGFLNKLQRSRKSLQILKKVSMIN